MKLQSRKPEQARRNLTMIMTFVLITTASESAFAFKPFNKGRLVLQGAAAPTDHTHESITREAVYSAVEEFFSMREIPPAVRGAVEEVVEANARVDYYQLSPHYHFDEESIEAGHIRLVTLPETIKKALETGNTQVARKTLGSALHTLQDFYAHSNWIELGNQVPHPHLGRFLPATIDPLVALRASIAQKEDETCIGCESFPDPGIPDACHGNSIGEKLTTGYFAVVLLLDSNDNIIPPKPAGKCSHGGASDVSAILGNPRGGINKDSSVHSVSPHFFLHKRAGTVAILATQQYLRDLKSFLNPVQWRTLFGFEQLVLANNNRTSPGTVQISINGRGIRENGELAPFSVFPQITIRPLQFKAIALPDLSAIGVHTLHLYLTDSESATGLFGYTMTLPSHLRFLSVKSGRGIETALTGVTHSDMFIMRPPAGLSPLHRQNIYTIQRVPPVQPQNAILATTALPVVDLLSVAGKFDGTPKTYVAVIDPSIRDLTIRLSGAASAEIKRPNGSVVRAEDSGVFVQAYGTGISYTIPVTGLGHWTISLNEKSGDFELFVSGNSALEFSRFEFVHLAGRPGHQGFFQLDGEPVAGRPSYAHATMTSEVVSAQFEFRSPNGATLKQFHLERESRDASSEFFGEVEPPDTEFLTYVTGIDASGSRFQRVAPRVMKAQPLTVTAPSPLDLIPGRVSEYVFLVENHGAEGTFQMTAQDTRSYVTKTTPESVFLRAGQRSEVTVTVSPPEDAPIGASDTVSLVAQSATLPDVRNYAAILVGIFQSAATPPTSPPTLSISRQQGDIVLTWSAGATLQWAASPSGPWNDILGDFNFISVVPIGVQKYYRARW